MKKLIALLLALALVIGLVACGNKTPDAPAVDDKPVDDKPVDDKPVDDKPADPVKKTIYVLVPNPDHGWTGAIGVAAQEKTDELNAAGNYNVVMQTFATADDQIKQIEDIVANNPGDGSIGVAMLPAGNDVENAIQQLVDAGIPYTAADRIIPSVAPSAVSNVKYDNVEIGAAAASYLVKNGLKEGDKVAVIEGDGSSADTDRTDGFNKYLLGEVAYQGEYIATPWTSLDSVSYSGATGWNPANSQAWFETYLSNAANADTRYIASWDDGLSCGVFEALAGSAIDESIKAQFLAGKPYITGCGGAQVVYDTIAGNYSTYPVAEQFGGFMSVTYPPAMIQVTIQAMVDYFDGAEVLQDNTQSAECVDASNVANYKGFE